MNEGVPNNNDHGSVEINAIGHATVMQENLALGANPWKNNAALNESFISKE